MSISWRKVAILAGLLVALAVVVLILVRTKTAQGLSGNVTVQNCQTGGDKRCATYAIFVTAYNREQKVAEAKIDKNGQYNLQLKPGSYQVGLRSNPTGVIASPRTVEVKAGQFLRLDFMVAFPEPEFAQPKSPKGLPDPKTLKYH